MLCLSSNATENLIQGTKGKRFINSAPKNGVCEKLVNATESVTRGGLQLIYKSLAASLIKQFVHEASDQITLHQTSSETGFITRFSWTHTVLFGFILHQFSLYIPHGNREWLYTLTVRDCSVLVFPPA